MLWYLALDWPEVAMGRILPSAASADGNQSVQCNANAEGTADLSPDCKALVTFPSSRRLSSGKRRWNRGVLMTTANCEAYEAQHRSRQFVSQPCLARWPCFLGECRSGSSSSTDLGFSQTSCGPCSTALRGR